MPSSALALCANAVIDDNYVGLSMVLDVQEREIISCAGERLTAEAP